MAHRAIIGAAVTGSVSLAEARQAARAVKLARSSPSGSRANAGTKTASSAKKAVIWERYLGHFGSSARVGTKGGAATKRGSARKKVSVKSARPTSKASGKKASVRKTPAKNR